MDDRENARIKELRAENDKELSEHSAVSGRAKPSLSVGIAPTIFRKRKKSWSTVEHVGRLTVG